MSKIQKLKSKRNQVSSTIQNSVIKQLNTIRRDEPVNSENDQNSDIVIMSEPRNQEDQYINFYQPEQQVSNYINYDRIDQHPQESYGTIPIERNEGSLEFGSILNQIKGPCLLDMNLSRGDKLNLSKRLQWIIRKQQADCDKLMNETNESGYIVLQKFLLQSEKLLNELRKDVLDSKMS